LLFGIYLISNSHPRGFSSVDFQGGPEAFAILHGIMLGTCILFLPLYTGARLAAERGFTNMDLLFATTLPPRAIIGGKYLAALILALIIFSACTPFLFFTYLLRGIDWPTILFVVAMDFLAVALAVMVMIWIAVVPSHWIFKALLALLGLWGVFMLFVGAMALTVGVFLTSGVGGLAESGDFWATTWGVLTGVVGVAALFYSWSVALISPPSANRALFPRIAFFLFWLVSLPLQVLWSNLLPETRGSPLLMWVFIMGLLCALQMVIAINERESWSPRTARTIPRSWWLRAPAFLFYSGAAGGLCFACLLFGLTVLVGVIAAPSFPLPEAFRAPPGSPFRPFDPWTQVTKFMLVIGLYTLAYALTAVLVRRASPWRIALPHTWIVFVALLIFGLVVPLLTSIFLHFGTLNLPTHYGWVLVNPIAALVVIGDLRAGQEHIELAFMTAAAVWVGIAFLLNVPWFVRQLRAFRPYTSPSGAVQRGLLANELTQAHVATTKTL